VQIYQQLQACLNRENRPAAVYLFMGPTGTGKTQLVREAAEFILGKKDAITRIDCSEYAHSHEVAKLFGSPPGYLGHGDKGSVRLSQEKIDKFQTPKHKINILLFDEIEEAHDDVFSAILQILDAGRLTLGTGEETDFTKTIVIMTSNLGEKETQQVLMGKELGLVPPSHDERANMDEEVYKQSKAAAAKHFKAKFMNRIDRVIVFRSLSQDSLEKILSIQLRELEYRLWSTAMKRWEAQGGEGSPQQFRVIFKTTKSANDFLLKEGTSQIYGARELNRAVERFVAFPLGSLIGSNQLEHGDVLEIDYLEGAKDLVFKKVAHRELRLMSSDVEIIVPVKEQAPPPPEPLKEPAKPEGWIRRPWKG
jgi:ATP-dependent Clp protease ATP-binding subunit ClpA